MNPNSEELSDPESATAEVSADAQSLSEAARKDLNFLAGLAIPTLFQYLYPSVFLSVWEWLKENVHSYRTFPQLALGLPRGFGKTTLRKTLHPIHYPVHREALHSSN
jgi:hypothetical protein